MNGWVIIKRRKWKGTAYLRDVKDLCGLDFAGSQLSVGGTKVFFPFLQWQLSGCRDLGIFAVYPLALEERGGG